MQQPRDLSCRARLVGDDRLEQKGWNRRYDRLRYWPFGADVALAVAGKRAENGVRSAHLGRSPSGGLGENRGRSDEEVSQGQLEIGDGAMSIGEGGLEMGEDLCGRLVFGVGRRPRQRLRRRTASEQDGADLALGQVEPLPDALPGPFTPLALDVPAGGEDASGECELEEARQGVGGDAEPADFVGEPDAEGPAATGACLAVAAEDPPGRRVFRWGLASSKPYKQPCRFRLPTTLQCGQGICLSCWARVSHS